MPRDLFDVSGIEAWCGDCMARLPQLAGYLRVRAAVYASDYFLVTSGMGTPTFDLASVPGGDAIVAANPYLQTLLGGGALPAKRAALASERGGRFQEAILGFVLARSYDPSDREVYEHLTRLVAAEGHAGGSVEAR
jgi:hypothetical protein